MSNDVVLSAALRNNLISLQDTQNQIDTHQQRLATGKKVNSALDNPQNFFASQALDSRANQLTSLLDSIGQSIQTINAANNGITALTSLVNNAQALANTAQSTLASSTTQASQTGNVALNAQTKWTNITNLAAGNQLTIDVTDPTGPNGTNKLVNVVVSTSSGDTVGDVIARINDLNASAVPPVSAVSASLDSNGHLNFTAVNGGVMDITFQNAAAAWNDTSSLAMAAALGFGNQAKLNLISGGNGTTGDQVAFTAATGSTLSTGALYATTGATTALADASTTIGNLKTDATGAAAATNITSINDTLTLTVGGKTSADLFHTTQGAFSYNATSTTIGVLVDAINHDSNISSLISASFNATTGQIVLSPLTSAATDMQIQLGSPGGAGQSIDLVRGTGLGFGSQILTTGAAPGTKATEDIYFGAPAAALGNLQTQYNSTLSQIDSLVKDTGYAGINLLSNNNLTTYFNETRSTSLTTNGVNFSSAGLGLTQASFNSTAAINATIQQTIAALGTIQNYGSTLANNLSVIQSRQTFTTSLINTLQTGSSALVNADQNQEGATLLALQTRQSLGITSLSLASQAQQAILKLF
jgi:flagellin-like hook-associated protein FlgL